ncbi:vesicle transport protein SFT2B-like [Eucyclogobius newberryi]|uniref:vesicle transport protein SFT2B-like n=1 Tax=Eucyclogobius newberryi TaxID=166745 RepID=UPI003B5C9958
MCLVISSFSLRGFEHQLQTMFDQTRAASATWMIIGFVLTQLTVFWWDSFVLASCFCVLFILSMLWYCLSYVPFGRKGMEWILF